ncbi:SurA N-terminal domain-containing protein [Massilia eburnea]|uniref:SurA N-terminal domain-containing protein n=1 Tax=Massilia eburnea TaxID=1776165 RepID=UPI003D6B86D9
MQIILALLIVPSFVLVGVGGVKLFGEDANTIAKVAGHPADPARMGKTRSAASWTRCASKWARTLTRRRIDTPEFKQNILDQLIAQRAMNAEIRTAHLTVSEQKVQDAITSQLPLFKADGTFDKEQYLQILAAQGMNAGMHQEQVRHDLAPAAGCHRRGTERLRTAHRLQGDFRFRARKSVKCRNWRCRFRNSCLRM